jgi:hypothetical protein
MERYMFDRHFIGPPEEWDVGRIGENQRKCLPVSGLPHACRELSGKGTEWLGAASRSQ